VEIETRYKAELGRLKKKYDSEIKEYEITIENLNRVNADLQRAGKGAQARIKVLMETPLSSLKNNYPKHILKNNINIF